MFVCDIPSSRNKHACTHTDILGGIDRKEGSVRGERAGRGGKRGGDSVNKHMDDARLIRMEQP